MSQIDIPALKDCRYSSNHERLAYQIGEREDQLRAALTQLAELRAASEWVSVEDRLPEYSGVSQIEQYVIAFTNKGIGPYTSVGYFADGKWWEIPFDTDLEHLTVTHWKPIPLPPQPSPASAVEYCNNNCVLLANHEGNCKSLDSSPACSCKIGKVCSDCLKNYNQQA